MSLLRLIGVLLLAVIALAAMAFYVLANHSTNQITLTCTCAWVQGAEGIKGQPETVLAVIEEYRPWVLWTESDGNVRAESRDFALAAYFNFLRRMGEAPMVNYLFSRDSDDPMTGGYRGSFRELTVEFGTGLVFDGTCVQT